MVAVAEKQQIEVTGYRQEYDSDIFIMCQCFVDESLAEYGMTVTSQRLQQMTELCKGISFFLVDDQRPVGLIAGLVVESLTNGKPALQEVIWYVLPDYRRHGHKLLKEFELAAKDLQMSSIIMASMCNSMHERVDRIYKKMGYKPFEVQYIKEIN